LAREPLKINKILRKNSLLIHINLFQMPHSFGKETNFCNVINYFYSLSELMKSCLYTVYTHTHTHTTIWGSVLN